MDELIAFLTARLDEDESVMRRVLMFSHEGYAQGAYESWAAERKVNNVEPPYYDYQSVRTERTATRPIELVRLELDLGGHLADHIARFGSPKRVLADVAAKRRVVMNAVMARRVLESHERLPSSPTATDQQVLVMGAWESAVRLLASAYADHSDFKADWRPA